MCESMAFYIIDITILYYNYHILLYNSSYYISLCLFIIYNASAKLNISLILLLLFYKSFAYYVILFCIFKHPNKIYFT